MIMMLTLIEHLLYKELCAKGLDTCLYLIPETLGGRQVGWREGEGDLGFVGPNGYSIRGNSLRKTTNLPFLQNHITLWKHR